MGLSCGEIHM
jgi:hypothetical protein